MTDLTVKYWTKLFFKTFDNDVFVCPLSVDKITNLLNTYFSTNLFDLYDLNYNFVDVLDNAERDYNISINNDNTAYINIMLQTDTQCYNVDFLLKNNILHLTDFNVI